MYPYLVWCPELGSNSDDGQIITASDPEEAATIWARRKDSESEDYWIVNGDGTDVIVLDENGNELKIHVNGERCLHYYARKTD